MLGALRRSRRAAQPGGGTRGGDGHAAGHGGHRRRSGPGGRRRAHRVRVRPWGDGGAGPDRAPVGADPPGGGRGTFGRNRGRRPPTALGGRGGHHGPGHERAGWHLHPTLCRGGPGAAGAGAGRGGGAARRGRLRGDRGPVHRARRRADVAGDGPGRRGGPRHRGLHPHAEGRGAHPGPGVLADDRHRAPARYVLGPGRAEPAGDVCRPPAPGHLRAADGGRPDGLRRTRRPLPLRLLHPTGVRPRRRRARGPSPHAGRPLSGAGRVRDHPPVGRPAGHRPRLVHLRRTRRADRDGVGGGLRG